MNVWNRHYCGFISLLLYLFIYLCEFSPVFSGDRGERGFKGEKGDRGDRGEKTGENFFFIEQKEIKQKIFYGQSGWYYVIVNKIKKPGFFSEDNETLMKVRTL